MHPQVTRLLFIIFFSFHSQFNSTLNTGGSHTMHQSKLMYALLYNVLIKFTDLYFYYLYGHTLLWLGVEMSRAACRGPLARPM